MLKRTFILAILLMAIVSGCHQKQTSSTPDSGIELLEVPAGFPPIPFPEKNAFTEARWKLGKKLFFDPALSRDSSISCGSCHEPTLAFADTHTISRGVNGATGPRNAPTLANVAYHPYFTREGGVSTLEKQVLVPVQEHDEFDINIVIAAGRFQKDSTYNAMSLEAYDRVFDAYVITRALATYERTIISGQSRYDAFLASGDSSILTREEHEGLSLFFSDRLQCSACHSGIDFSNYSFENNGMFEDYEDAGRYRLTLDSNDIGLFKVPSLRNVQLTAPYMHNGGIESLEEVIERYSAGGSGFVHKSAEIRPLNLTPTEKAALIHFLNSLTDETLATNPAYLP